MPISTKNSFYTKWQKILSKNHTKQKQNAGKIKTNATRTDKQIQKQQKSESDEEIAETNYTNTAQQIEETHVRYNPDGEQTLKYRII